MAFHGAAGLRSLVADLASRKPGLETQVRGVRDLGDRLIVSVALAARSSQGQSPQHAYEVACVLFLQDGKVRRAVSLASEAEAAEVAEQPTPEEFRAAFERGPAPTALLDDECCFHEINAAAAKFFGGASADLRGRQFEDFVPPSRNTHFRELWDRLVGGAELATDFVLADGTGTARSVELRGKSNYTPGRHVLAFSQRGVVDNNKPRTHALTPREREIFQLLALGFTGREIADRLVLSPDTVRTHVQNGIGRLGARTRGQAIALALHRGDITL
jgi:PAS domain S-box-containing protein